MQKNGKFFLWIIVHLRFYNNQNNSTCEDNVKSVKYFLARKKFDVYHLQCCLREAFDRLSKIIIVQDYIDKLNYRQFFCFVSV